MYLPYPKVTFLIVKTNDLLSSFKMTGDDFPIAASIMALTIFDSFRLILEFISASAAYLPRFSLNNKLIFCFYKGANFS